MTIAERTNRRLTMGRIIVHTFHIISATPLLFAALTVIPAIPSLSLRYEQAISGAATLSTSFLISYLAYILCSYLVMAAVAKALVLNTAAGHRASLQACLAEIARDFLGVTVLAIVASFVTAAAIITSPVYPVALILLIPGFFIAVFLAVIVPVRTIEKPGLMATLNRSMELTRGHRWPILAFIVLFTILAIAYETFLYAVLGAPAFSESATPAQLLLLSASDSANAIINAVAASVIYFELRLIKEGIAPEAVTAEFD